MHVALTKDRKYMLELIFYIKNICSEIRSFRDTYSGVVKRHLSSNSRSVTRVTDRNT